MAAQLYHMEINYLKLLKDQEVSCQIIVVYSDCKNLKRNIYKKKMPRTFQDFSQDPRSKSKVGNQIKRNQIERFLHTIWPPAFPIIYRMQFYMRPKYYVESLNGHAE